MCIYAPKHGYILANKSPETLMMLSSILASSYLSREGIKTYIYSQFCKKIGVLFPFY